MRFYVKNEKTNKIVSVYGPLCTIRNLMCEIYLDDKKIYEGNIDDIPQEIKEYKYHEVKYYGSIAKFYINSGCNNMNNI